MASTELTRRPDPDLSATASLDALAQELWSAIGVLRRRWRLLLGITVGGVALAAAYTSVVPNLYTTTSSVMLNQRTESVVDSKNQVLSDLPRDPTVVDTQVEFLRGGRIATMVAQRLQLGHDQNFLNGAANPVKMFIKRLIGKPPVVSNLDEADSTEAAAEVVQGNASIDKRGLTSVIDITYTDTDPQRAARIANEYAQAYLLAQVQDKVNATRGANKWLSDQTEALRGEVKDAENAVATYQATHGLLVATGSAVTEQRVAQLQVAENAARADLAEKAAKLATARQELAMGRSGEELSVTLSSPVIQNLRQQLTTARQHQADVETRYGPKYPDVITTKNQIAELEGQVQAEIKRIIGGLQSDVSAAQGRLSSLDGSLGAAQGTLATGKSAEVGLDELQRNATAKRTLYESYLARMQQTAAEAGLANPDAVVLEQALPPANPSAPKPVFNLIVGGMLGLSSSLALVALLELLSTGVRTSAQVERKLGENFAGAIPLLKAREGNPLEVFVDRPLSQFAEALRRVRVSMQHSPQGGEVQAVAVTSALPDEGKTTTSVALARSAGLAGSRVLVIDCDLRMRSLTRKLGLSPKTGLLDCLESGVDPANAIISDPMGCMHVLPLSNRPAPSWATLDTPAMATLLGRMKEEYDLILMDCPPVLAVTDALAAARIADATLFLVRWQSTPMKAAFHGLQALRSAEARILGVALSQVDLQAQHDDTDMLGYYRAYTRYAA